MIKKILVPVDFEESGNAGVAKACELAAAVNAELVLVHADEYPVMPLGEIAYLPAHVIEEHAAAIKRRLAAMVEEIQKSGLRVAGKVVLGPAYFSILEAVKSEQPELIVMGTHGRRGHSRWFLGSVAERIVRTSPIPVLAVHGAA